MAKGPGPGKCVHCLSDPVERNWDHVFPKSWYPDVTPKDLAKWQVPSCIPCNSKYGWIESDFLSRVGLALEPYHPASRSVVETAMRSMKATAGRDERDRERRLARRRRIRAETLQGAAIPHGATIPGMGERWGRPIEEQVAVLLPAQSLRLMTEKIVRGIFCVQDGVFIEPALQDRFLSSARRCSGDLERDAGYVRHRLFKASRPRGTLRHRRGRQAQLLVRDYLLAAVQDLR
jgi:hypothetical protein